MDSIAGLMAVGFTEYEARVVELSAPARPRLPADKDAGIRARWSTRRCRLSARGAVLKTEEAAPPCTACA
jgi:hypothetical protein